MTGILVFFFSAVALILAAWLVWKKGWLGVYILCFMVAAYLIERWSPRVGVHPLVAVIPFVIAATLLGFRVFRRRADEYRRTRQQHGPPTI